MGRSGEEETRRSAKPLCIGSTPVCASRIRGFRQAILGESREHSAGMNVVLQLARI